MLFKTNDYGAGWTEINEGIPANDFTRVIRADPGRRGLLYAGTETGAYVSFDDGGSWQPMQANLPVAPVYDLQIRDNDLIAATHGRVILDSRRRDAAPSDRRRPSRRGGSSSLKPRTAYRLASPFKSRKLSEGKNYQLSLGAAVTFTESKGAHGETVRKFLDAGQNPPDGVVVSYWLGPNHGDDLSLSFLDAEGNLIVSYSSKEPEEGSDEKKPEPRPPAESGMNRFVWNMRYPDAQMVPDDKLMEDSEFKPLASPGRYQVRLTLGGDSQGEFQTQTFEIVKDPRVEATQDDFNAQFELLTRIRDKLSATHESIVRLRSVRQQVDEWVARAETHSAQPDRFRHGVGTKAEAHGDRERADSGRVQGSARPAELAIQAQLEAGGDHRGGRRGRLRASEAGVRGV